MTLRRDDRDVHPRLTTRVPGRAGLVGNPSDGYHGRVVSVAIDNFGAEVELTPWDGISITASEHDLAAWHSLIDLREESERFGYTGGVQLIQAALAAYGRLLDEMGVEAPGGGFRLAYRTSIPRQVGLAGSSAIVLATLRAVMAHHRMVIPPELVPSLALVAEQQLGITAGLQDRVVQWFGGVVAMDFRKRRTGILHGLEHGDYRFLDPAGLPPLYVAWSSRAAGASGSVHSDLRARFERREWAVTSGMKMLASLAEQGEDAIRLGDHERLAALMDEAFEVRRRMVSLPPVQVEMVDRARSAGVSATFAGSGGAIVGVYRGIEQINDLQARLEPLGATVERVKVAPEFTGGPGAEPNAQGPTDSGPEH